MRFPKFSEVISSYVAVEQQDIAILESLLNYESVKKGTCLVEPGKSTDKMFFVLSGYLRTFRTLETAEEQVVHLSAPGCFITSINSFFLGAISKETLQAITDCEILYISKSDLEKLYSMDSKWQAFGRMLMEGILIGKEERIVDLLFLTAHEKYLKLIEQSPDIIQNVPVKYIASFIGIQPESLSRIRKTIEK